MESLVLSLICTSAATSGELTEIKSEKKYSGRSQEIICMKESTKASTQYFDALPEVVRSLTFACFLCSAVSVLRTPIELQDPPTDRQSTPGIPST